MEKKRLNLLLPSALLKMHAKVCIDLGISQTESFTQYLRCVQEQSEVMGCGAPLMPIGFDLEKQGDNK